MSFLRLLYFLALIGIALPQCEAKITHSELKLSALEARLNEIDQELKELPAIALRSDSGAIGYRSESHTDPHNTEWIQIDLEQDQAIEEIVLVPTIRRGSQDGFQADAFPNSFHIIAGSKDDSEGQVIASSTAIDQLLPRAAPLVIACPDLHAAWVRIVASELSMRAVDEQYVFQLAEVMLFSKGRNIALGQAISASTSSPGTEIKFAAHNQNYIVDGFVPYLMDSYQGTKSPAFYSTFPVETTPALTIDLEAPHSINQINIHAMELSDSVPQTNRDDYGLPKQLRIEAANQANYSDATVLVDYQMESIYDSGPIIVLHFPEQTYRYLKLTALKPDTTNHSEYTTIKILGFAEIEVLSANTNVALGKTVAVNTEPFPGRNNFEALTDGRNFYGELIPFDQWMRQLARRHDLEVERPKILDAINLGYARQKANLRLMGYLAAALAVGIIIIYLIGRMRAMRQIALVRKRFAADLHDELGANLHAIGLLSDLAFDALDEKERLQRIIGEVRTVTERTSDAVRYCANSQEARDPMDSLWEDMERIAKRMMHGLSYEITVKGEPYLRKLKLRTRHDLFLFYKECLVNISRHSDATAFSVQLTADAKHMMLYIEDNGQGYKPNSGMKAPPSLKRRAQLMRASLNLESPKNGGTRIILKLKHRSYLFITK